MVQGKLVNASYFNPLRMHFIKQNLDFYGKLATAFLVPIIITNWLIKILLTSTKMVFYSILLPFMELGPF